MYREFIIAHNGYSFKRLPEACTSNHGSTRKESHVPASG